ncbi:MAG: hypothetical protein EXR60_06770 [Dehalococcoidia bacterium]|nr:hypothetical protein [Dehalococcoidia bacterium]
MNAKERAQRLSESLDALLEGQPAAARRQTASEADPELGQLLQTAAAIQRLAQDISPRAEFKAAARARFLVALAQRRREPAARRWSLELGALHPASRPWLSAAASLVLLLAAGAGTVGAASSSLPQEALYPVKRASERVQGFFAVGAEPRVRFQLRTAERRLQELLRLQSGGREAPPALFADLGQATDRAVALLAPLAPDQGLQIKEEALQKLAEVNARRQETLLALLARAEPRVQASLAPAIGSGALDAQRVNAALRTVQETKAGLQVSSPGAQVQRSGLITRHGIRSLVAGPHSIRFDDDTRLEGTPELGQVAEVVGVVQPDGSILASQVRVRPPSPDGRAGELPTHRVRATIEAMEPEAWSLDGHTILVTANTLILGAPAVGSQAEFLVTILPDGRILALLIDAAAVPR